MEWTWWNVNRHGARAFEGKSDHRFSAEDSLDLSIDREDGVAVAELEALDGFGVAGHGRFGQAVEGGSEGAAGRDGSCEQERDDDVTSHGQTP